MASRQSEGGALWRWAPEIEAEGAVVTALGYDADGLDEPLGSVVGVSPRMDGGYLVIDASGWADSGRAMVPAGAVRRVDHAARRVEIGLRRKDVAKALPFQDDCDREAYRRSCAEHFTERLRRRAED